MPVTRISEGRIPWPITTVNRGRGAFMLCGDLVKAVRRESATAICYWWGVTNQTVSKWRKALGVGLATEGTLKLHARWFPEKVGEAERRTARERANTPEANAKKAAAKLGKPRPPHVQAILAKFSRRKRSAAWRRKVSATHKRLGTRPRHDQQLWTPEHDALLGTMPDAELAPRIGQTVMAIMNRRAVLRIPAFIPAGRGPKGYAMTRPAQAPIRGDGQHLAVPWDRRK